MLLFYANLFYYSVAAFDFVFHMLVNLLALDVQRLSPDKLNSETRYTISKGWTMIGKSAVHSGKNDECAYSVVCLSACVLVFSTGILHGE